VPGHSPIQTSFAGGELSARLRGRVDTELYKKGLATCENFEPMPQGSLRMRCGTEYVADCPDPETRLIAFPTRSAGTFLLELSPLELRIFDTRSLELALNSPNLVVGGQFAPGIPGWIGSAEGLYRGWEVLERYAGNYGLRLFLEPSTPPVGYIRESITVDAATDYLLSFELYDRVATGAVRVRVGTSAGGSQFLSTTISKYGYTVVSFNSGAATTVWLEFAIATTGVATFDISVSIDDVQLRDASGATVITTPWNAQHLDEICTALETAKDRMVLAHPNVETQVLVRNADSTWTLTDITDLATAPPGEWTGANWPGVCEIYQGRLWLAATPDEGHRIWASRAGSPFDFTLETNVGGTDVVLPADGIDLKISTRGSIRWMRAGRALLVGTDLGEHSITAQAGVVTPTDVQVRDESAFGSCANVPAVNSGELALYVSGDQRKVRALSYDLQTSGWNSKDITFTSEHITRGLVKELHHARDPNGSIVLLLLTGELAVCTFEPGEGVAAWWRLSSGSIQSVAVSHGALGSYLWLAVDRGGNLFLERLPMAETDAAYCDSSVTVELDPAQVDLTGLDHLEGKTVKVVLDGALLPDQVVSAGGLTLPQSGTSVTVGLAFTATATTLPLEGGNPAGTAQGAKRRRTRVVLRLNESALPKVDGDRAADRTPGVPMGIPEALRSSDVAAWATGWNDGQVTIEQDLPIRTEVLALYGGVQVNEV
jgi:hypothetical protein